MDEAKLTVRMSHEDRQALRLHAVLQGRSVQDLVTELIRAELAKGSPTPKVSREEFVAELYARRGIDPVDPEHQAVERKARDSVRRTSGHTAAGGGQQGAA